MNDQPSGEVLYEFETTPEDFRFPNDDVPAKIVVMGDIIVWGWHEGIRKWLPNWGERAVIRRLLEERKMK